MGIKLGIKFLRHSVISCLLALFHVKTVLAEVNPNLSRRKLKLAPESMST
jgi:hypothetical protein